MINRNVRFVLKYVITYLILTADILAVFVKYILFCRQ